MIMWLIGLSGAGKSTLAEAIAEEARQRGAKLAVVDGDAVREMWGDSLGHDLAGRKKNAERICRLCAYLDSQGIHAVCAILSLFEESREWNRAHFSNYHEAYIKTPLEDLEQRDGKGLYLRARRNEIELPGINMNFPEPLHPDEIIENSGNLELLLSNAPRLAALFA